MSLNEILASGGALLLFLTLVQITPIKVNPWSAVGKIIRNGMRAIGKSMNKDVMDKLESVQKELKDLGEKHNKLERRMDKDDADECRTRILRFADELRRDVKHSEEFFNQILEAQELTRTVTFREESREIRLETRYQPRRITSIQKAGTV